MVAGCQCDQIWRNFVNLVKLYESFGKFLTVHFLSGKMLSLLWQICEIIGLEWPNIEK